MDPHPIIDGDPLLSITTSALKNTPKSKLQAFCLKYNLDVATSGKRNQSIKGDYVACILSHKRGLVTPVKAHETAVVESGRKYKPRKRRKTEKALAAESQSLKRSGDALVQSATKRLKTLALKDDISTEDAMGMISHIDRRTHTTSVPRPLTWIPGGRAVNTNLSVNTVVTKPLTWIHHTDTPTRKKIEASPAQSSKNDARVPADTAVGPEMVGVRIYRRATDMEHILQAQACCGTNREVDLDKIGEQLLLKGNCHLIDPGNSKPFYPYNGRIVDGDDVDDLKDPQNFLRIICDNAVG